MAPSLCEIWFVKKGTLIWKRESSYVEPPNQDEYFTASNLLSRSMPSYTSKNILFNSEFKRSCSARTASFRLEDHFRRVGVSVDVASSYTLLNTRSGAHVTSPVYFGSNTEYRSSGEPWISSDSVGKGEEEMLYELNELMKEAERTRNEASTERLLRRKLELEVVESIKEVKAFVHAHAHESELRKEAEDELRSTIQQQQKLVQQKEETTRKLQQEMKRIAIYNNRAQEARCRCDDIAMNLKLIQHNMADLQKENQKIQRQKIEATVWLDRQKNRGAGFRIMELNGEECDQLEEFSLSDLQAATCNFSESFKIGQGRYGAVYKGELLERTVAIKRLHPHNIHRQSEFYQQARVLGRLRHPHLVSLIGVCPEAWSLVYDHIPNGSLQKRLFCTSNNNIPLDWKIRVRIIAEIASCLLYLHSLNLEQIAHGDLKPNNILLDAFNTCKLCDYGINRLIPPPDQLLRWPSFGHPSETTAFPYADPEFFRTGILSTKSDVFSFGIIILQLVTGRSPDGLVSEVRKGVSRGKTISIVDLSGGEWSMFVVRRLVDLGLHCCEMNGKDRPEITPMLVRELEQLYVLEDRVVPSSFLCPIFQEIMHDPRVASDGFTYEGEALREWLENGGETSPMTNLKLSDLNQTPNHSLRLAIQDWVCNLQAPT